MKTTRLFQKFVKIWNFVKPYGDHTWSSKPIHFRVTDQSGKKYVILYPPFWLVDALKMNLFSRLRFVARVNFNLYKNMYSQLTVNLKFLLTAGGTLFFAMHKYVPMSSLETFCNSNTSPWTRFWCTSFPFLSWNRILALSFCDFGFFDHIMVGCGCPVAEQINFAEPPSATLRSSVLCLSDIWGGITTSRVAT